MKIADIIQAIEEYANPALQEKWDNTGLQVGSPHVECTGVMICLDPTPQVVQEAINNQCNLIVSHHPLFFKPIKSLTGQTLNQSAAIAAITSGISIYSSHTAADSANGGVSYVLARKLGVNPIRVLSPISSDDGEGLGIIGSSDSGLSPHEFALMVKERLGCPGVRISSFGDYDGTPIRRVAVCGGAGGEFIERAIAMGVQAYVTGDIRYHDFVDYGDQILLIDAGHYSTEWPITEMFSNVLKNKFPELPILISNTQENPINFL